MKELKITLPFTVGDEIWYASEDAKEVWLVTVKAIRADWTKVNQEQPGITLTLARQTPSQLIIQTDASDIGRSVFVTAREGYAALDKWQRG